MKITYDTFANAAYIYFSNKKAKKTVPVTDSIIIDIDKDGGLIGVEVLNASKNMSRELLDKSQKFFGLPA